MDSSANVEFPNLNCLANAAVLRLRMGELHKIPDEWLKCFTKNKEIEFIAKLGAKELSYFKNEDRIEFLGKTYNILHNKDEKIVITKDEFFRVEERYIQYFICQMLLRRINRRTV